MASGLWTAVSGAAAQAQNVDMVANNLANADTLGYKKDLPTFREYLAKNERDNTPTEVPRGPIKDKDFNNIQGKDQAFVIVDGTYTNFRQGNIRVTNSQLDVALDGPGFIEVSTPQGIRYTRQGSLKMAMDGRLVTTQGYPVLTAQAGGLAARTPSSATELGQQVQPGQGGLQTQGRVGVENAGPVPGAPDDPNVSGRFINLRDKLRNHAANLSFTEAGEVYAGDELVGKMSVTEFVDSKKLRKFGNQLFENKDNANISSDPGKTILRQGMLETSNVNPIEEMTNLIKANRMFDHDMKAMKTYNDLLGREANDIGKL
ncbi:MAG: flagellar hook-basal body protein [Methylotenera sp.]|nr:flagellar hook-basal body protein [Oligoflexia bacterium]